ncbi:hypothetical protein OLX02_10665 [Novosphingobium sp. KCTC 2891]|uniref:hypothetical protein n=1 Tax=Novosphingobium sp. KCTC 2891 TaxID=2989730 RepID=UPI002222BBBF|nr:hypothetical protein [Novosphingobium sp. KCTC 2891]MCW1383285.1 hypothetical protein [Novosphingobium sp. KCTC 2891]
MDSSVETGERGATVANRTRRIAWAAATGAGAACAAWIGVHLFPQVRFAQSPTGVFRWEMAGLAGIVGTGFAAAQTALLAWWRPGGMAAMRIALWMPLTAIAVAAMILPLWWTDAEVLILAPSVAAWSMGPGILLLTVVQGLLAAGPLRGADWAGRTAAGGIVGALAGLPGAMLLGSLVSPEAAWAGVVGALIGVMQGKMLIPAADPSAASLTARKGA